MHLTEKCHTLDVAINRFLSRIDALNQKGLPSLFVINDKLMLREDYMKKLKETVRAASMSSIKGSMTGRAFYEAIKNISFIQHEIKHIFTVKPIFAKYIEANEIYRRLIKFSIPDQEQWEKLCEYQD